MASAPISSAVPERSAGDGEDAWTTCSRLVRAVEGGVVSSALALRSCESGYRGLFATRAIATGALLIRVPVALCWSEATARSHLEAFGFVEDPGRGISALAAIAAHVMLEVRGVARPRGAPHGDACRAAHLGMMPGAAEAKCAERSFVPDEPDLPLRWLPEVREQLLRGTEAQESVQRLRAKAEFEWRKLHPALFGREPAALDPKDFPFDFFLWAWSVVKTRCINFSAELARLDASEDEAGSSAQYLLVVPLVDLINHSADVSADVNFDEADFSASDSNQSHSDDGAACAAEFAGLHPLLYSLARDESANDYVEFRADRDYLPAGEIMSCYGERLPNAVLFANFGFAVEANNFETLRVQLPLAEWLLPHARHFSRGRRRGGQPSTAEAASGKSSIEVEPNIAILILRGLQAAGSLQVFQAGRGGSSVSGLVLQIGPIQAGADGARAALEPLLTCARLLSVCRPSSLATVMARRGLVPPKENRACALCDAAVAALVRKLDADGATGNAAEDPVQCLCAEADARAHAVVAAALAERQGKYRPPPEELPKQNSSEALSMQSLFGCIAISSRDDKKGHKEMYLPVGPSPNKDARWFEVSDDPVVLLRHGEFSLLERLEAAALRSFLLGA